MKFQDPPTDPRNKHPHREIAAELRAHPNQWALVLENTSAVYVTSIKNGVLAAYRPAGTFESLSVSRNGRSDIYARYVGEAETND